MNIKCPHCGQDYDLSPDDIDKTAQCAVCSKDFVVENPNLMTCPDCFASVSRRASVCPHCGAPLSSNAPAANTAAREEDDPEKDIVVCQPAAIYFLLTIIVGIILTPVIYGLLMLADVIIKINCTVYRITSRRILVQTGWLNKSQAEIWIKDMRSVNLHRSFWDRIIWTGSNSIGTAATAGTEILMDAIRGAHDIIDTINALRKQ